MSGEYNSHNKPFQINLSEFVFGYFEMADAKMKPAVTTVTSTVASTVVVSAVGVSGTMSTVVGTLPSKVVGASKTPVSKKIKAVFTPPNPVMTGTLPGKTTKATPTGKIGTTASVVHMNFATESAMQLIPKLGPKTAEKIVSIRSCTGNIDAPLLKAVFGDKITDDMLMMMDFSPNTSSAMVSTTPVAASAIPTSTVPVAPPTPIVSSLAVHIPSATPFVSHPVPMTPISSTLSPGQVFNKFVSSLPGVPSSPINVSSPTTFPMYSATPGAWYTSGPITCVSSHGPFISAMPMQSNMHPGYAAVPAYPQGYITPGQYPVHGLLPVSDPAIGFHSGYNIPPATSQVPVNVPMASAPTYPASGSVHAQSGSTNVESASTSNRLNQKIPKYGGSTSFAAFKLKFERVAQSLHWSNEECIDYLCLSLTDKAEEFYVLLMESHSDLTYQQIIEKLQWRFGTRELPETAQVRFQHACQNSGETLEEWADRVLTLASRAFKDLPEKFANSQAVTRFCAGLQDKGIAKAASLQRLDSMDKAMEFVRWHQFCDQSMNDTGKQKQSARRVREHDSEVLHTAKEEIKEDMIEKIVEKVTRRLQQSGIGRQSKNNNNDNRRTSSSNVAGGHCYFCGKNGHVKSECRSYLRNIKCHKCGNFGHFKNNCKNTQPLNEKGAGWKADPVSPSKRA